MLCQSAMSFNTIFTINCFEQDICNSTFCSKTNINLPKLPLLKLPFNTHTGNYACLDKRQSVLIKCYGCKRMREVGHRMGALWYGGTGNVSSACHQNAGYAMVPSCTNCTLHAWQGKSLYCLTRIHRVFVARVLAHLHKGILSVLSALATWAEKGRKDGHRSNVMATTNGQQCVEKSIDKTCSISVPSWSQIVLIGNQEKTNWCFKISATDRQYWGHISTSPTVQTTMKILCFSPCQMKSMHDNHSFQYFQKCILCFSQTIIKYSNMKWGKFSFYIPEVWFVIGCLWWLGVV